MLLGWTREIIKQNRSKHPMEVIYRAPCGRRLRNLEEVHRYLRLTESQLGVDLFTFDSRVQCFIQFEPEIIFSSVNGNPSLGYFIQFVLIICVPTRYLVWSRERSCVVCQFN